MQNNTIENILECRSVNLRELDDEIIYQICDFFIAESTILSSLPLSLPAFSWDLTLTSHRYLLQVIKRLALLPYPIDPDSLEEVNPLNYAAAGKDAAIECSQTCSLIPNELWFKIYENLDLSSLKNMRMVCWFFKIHIEDINAEYIIEKFFYPVDQYYFFDLIEDPDFAKFVSNFDFKRKRFFSPFQRAISLYFLMASRGAYIQVNKLFEGIYKSSLDHLIIKSLQGDEIALSLIISIMMRSDNHRDIALELLGLGDISLDFFNFKDHRVNIDLSFLNFEAFRRPVYKPLYFTNLYLYKANFNEANLNLCHFSKSNLIEATFNGKRTRLAGTFLKGSLLMKASFLEANLNDANLFQANMEGVILEGATLKKANLNLSILKGASLRDANLRRATLVKAKMEGSTLDGAVMTGTKLSGATLTGASMVGTNLHGADLTQANMQEVDLTETNLSRCILDEADLRGAKNLVSIFKSPSFKNIKILCSQYQELLNIENENIREKRETRLSLNKVQLFDEDFNPIKNSKNRYGFYSTSSSSKEDEDFNASMGLS